MKTRCLIVDDEPPARDLLKSYLSKLDDFEMINEFGNGIDAFSFLQRHHIELLFLDIQMPNMSGIELIKTLHRAPRIVLVSAFREYAIEGFELDVLDYLVKPVTFERFMKTISKYHQYSRPVTPSSANVLEKAYIFVKVDKEQIKIFLKDIIYIESIKDYLKIVTLSKTFITLSGLTHMMERLPEDHFIRIHKSYIISIAHVASYRNECVRIHDKNLPVGRVFKQGFLDLFQRNDRIKS